MYNVFDIIKNHIRLSDTPTYGDILNENKSEAHRNAIKRMCNQDEYEEYQAIYAADKARLINESYTELKDNYLMNKTNNKNEEQYIPGIGMVKQIC